jgi:hypothetical protein
MIIFVYFLPNTSGLACAKNLCKRAEKAFASSTLVFHDLGTVGRCSHLSLYIRGCMELQQYFVAHGRVDQLAQQMAPVAYSLEQKHLCRCRESNPGCYRPKPTRYKYTIQAPVCLVVVGGVVVGPGV